MATILIPQVVYRGHLDSRLGCLQFPITFSKTARSTTAGTLARGGGRSPWLVSLVTSCYRFQPAAPVVGAEVADSGRPAIIAFQPAVPVVGGRSPRPAARVASSWAFQPAAPGVGAEVRAPRACWPGRRGFNPRPLGWGRSHVGGAHPHEQTVWFQPAAPEEAEVFEAPITTGSQAARTPTALPDPTALERHRAAFGQRRLRR